MNRLKRKRRESGKISTRNILVGLLVGIVFLGIVYLFIDRGNITDGVADAALERGMVSTADILLRLGGHPDRLNRLLEAAVLLDDRQRVERYLQNGADPDYIGAGNTPMVYLAAKNGFEETLALLAASGADMNLHPGHKQNPLLLIANKQNDKRAFRLLLANGSDPNVISDYGYPMAYICLRQKQYEWFKLLAAHGADLFYISPTRRSMLDYAIKYGHPETIALLTKEGVPVLRTEGAGTRLIEVIKNNDSNAVSRRLKAGDNPYFRDSYDLNAMETAVWGESVSAVRALLDSGVDPNVPFGKPLKAAVNKSNLTLVNLLLENGALPDTRRNRIYKTALHEAVCRSLPIVKTLIAHGADVNATHSWPPKTPLWRAMNCGDAEAIAFLESNGARYTVDDGWYRTGTAFEKAAADGNIGLMAKMVAAGQDVNERDAFGDTALHFAAAAGQPEAIRWLVDHGALPMFRGGWIRTPLFWAALHGQEEACRYLMENGCRVQDKDAHGETPLHFAARGNQAAIVKLFLDKGADVNANAKKVSPLMAAARRNAGEAARVLIDGGADINNHGSFGRTALHNALLYDSPDVVRVLLSRNADIHAKDKQDLTPLEAAGNARSTREGSRAYRQMMAAVGKPIRTSFNCDKASTAVEQLVCADRDLAELDVEMNRYYRVLVASLDPAKVNSLKYQQQRWMGEGPGSCVFSGLHFPEDDAFRRAVKCLKPIYQERVQVLKKSVMNHGFSMDVAPAAATEGTGVNTWGVATNRRDEAGDGRFRAFYFNTNDPANVVASELVEQISVNYHFNEFHGINSNHFGAYWVGAFEFPQERRMLFQVASGPSRMKIVVDGVAIFDADGVNQAEVPHWFTEGRHVIEVEYTSKWPTTDLLIRIAESEPVYKTADARVLLNDALVEDAHIWYAAVQKSDTMNHTVRVTTTATERPIVLFLSSYNAVNWVIPNAEENRILAVFYASSKPASSVSAASGSISKIYRVDRKVIPHVTKLPAGWWAGVESLSDRMEFLLEPHRLDGYTGSQRTNAIFIPSLTKDG